ncbi:TPA: hypothetical protein MAD96_003167 [Klebsiella pneumoniae]|nr:hypothetical protein [Klebsiella pneumoniae]
MEQIQGEGGSVLGFGRVRKRSVLGCAMSRNGIRSLVIALAISVLLWIGLAAYIKGVFYG